LKQAEETNPIYADEGSARRAGFEGPIVPPVMIYLYASVLEILSKLDRVLSAHFIHARAQCSFLRPIGQSETIVATARVADKYIKKERKYIVFDITVTNEQGETVAVNQHTTVWAE